MTEKLDSGVKHLIRLADRDADGDGWVDVSRTVWPHFKENVPDDLYEGWQREDGTARIRLTERGQAIADYA